MNRNCNMCKKYRPSIDRVRQGESWQCPDCNTRYKVQKFGLYLYWVDPKGKKTR